MLVTNEELQSVKSERDQLRAEVERLNSKAGEFRREWIKTEKERDQWREVAELAISGCKEVISPIRPRWKETMMRCADALAAYERLVKGETTK